MGVVEYVRTICAPAYVYLCLGALGILGTMIQNVGHDSKLCVGEFECEVAHVGTVFVAQGIYVAFWTFVLASICKAGHRSVAWFLVLIPFILGAIILAMFMMSRPGYRRQAPAGAYIPH
jgi:hypothetical protein